MENTKLINRNTMNKPNTRTIGINTDMNLMNIKCVKCLQDCVKFTFFPYYFPYPFPVCNCMFFSHFHNVIDYSNCKCENKNYINSCSHHSIQNCYTSSSTSSCQNCGSKSSFNANESIHQTSSNDSVDNSEERHEERLNVSLRSSRNSLKGEDFEKVYPKDETEYNSIAEEISNSNITKYAADFLEKNYRAKYGFKPKTHTKNEEKSKDNTEVQHEILVNDKKLLNHLLKPNTSNNKTTVVKNEDSDDFSESDNEQNVSEDDDFSAKTVIELDKERPSSSDDRRPTRININNTTHSQPTSEHSMKRPQTRNSDVEMLMMIKALVNNQYDKSNSPPLNKLLNHIGSENAASPELKKASSPSPRRKLSTKNFINTPKSNENKKSS